MVLTCVRFTRWELITKYFTDMKTKKIDAYKANARGNVGKTRNAAEIAVGDFLYLVTGHGKENGLRDYIRTPERGNGSTLVKVVDVVDVPEDFDLLRGWMEQPAPEHRGGSQSDDVPEDHTPYNYTPEEISTFFQLVTVYRNRKGQFIAVDCQGYDYWRYVYLSAYWREMFADEAEGIAKEYAEEQRAIIEAERKEQEKQAEEYAAKLAALRVRYPKMKENPKGAAGITANVKKWFAAEFPGYAVQVSTRHDYWGTEYHVTARMSRNIPEDKQAEIYSRVNMWNESMPTGERDEGRTVYGYPMGIFGNIGYRCLNVNFFGD